MLPKSDDRFDQELAGWFSLRRGAWYGTAAQLLASIGKRSDSDDALWPQSPRALYAHLESHKRILQSFGVDVSVLHGVPRMVSLRSCQNEPLHSTPVPDEFEVAPPPSDVSSPVDAPQERPADLRDPALPANVAYPGGIPAAKSGLGKGKYADGDNSAGRIFEDTGEALFAIAEMRRQVEEHRLDLESAVDLVVGSARKFTRSCGIAVGFLPQEESMGHLPQPGTPASTKGPYFHANLFRSTLMAGEAVMLPDATKHPVLGVWCKREGIGSMILVPIFRNREVAGAMEFLFSEKRFFSNDDVMDLGLIAGVISGSLPEAAEDVEAKSGHSRNQKADPGQAVPSRVKDTMDDAICSKESSTPEPIIPASRLPETPGAPLRFWRSFKRAWVRP